MQDGPLCGHAFLMRLEYFWVPDEKVGDEVQPEFRNGRKHFLEPGQFVESVSPESQEVFGLLREEFGPSLACGEALVRSSVPILAQMSSN